MKRAAAAIALVACVHGHKADQRGDCGPPVAAREQRPGRQVIQAQDPSIIGALAVSSHGRVASSTSDGRIQIWDAASARLVASWPDHAWSLGWDDD